MVGVVVEGLGQQRAADGLLVVLLEVADQLGRRVVRPGAIHVGNAPPGTGVPVQKRLVDLLPVIQDALQDSVVFAQLVSNGPLQKTASRNRVTMGL